MTSAASAPGPSLSEPKCFLGRLQSAGLHSLLPVSCLLSPVAPEGGPEGSVAEPWVLPRTREAEVLRKVPGEFPSGTVLPEAGGGLREQGPTALVTRGLKTEHGGYGGVWMVIFFCWRQEARSDWGHGAEASRGGGGCGTWPRSAVLGIQGACCSLLAFLPGDVQGRSPLVEPITWRGVGGGRVWIKLRKSY